MDCPNVTIEGNAHFRATCPATISTNCGIQTGFNNISNASHCFVFFCLVDNEHQLMLVNANVLSS